MKHSRLASGVAWTYAGMAASAALQVGVAATTARLLDPSAFGLLALASVLLRFGTFFSQMGVARALVQRRALDPGHARAGLILSSTLGGSFAALFTALAWPLAHAAGQPEVTPVLRALAATFLVSGVGAVPQAMIQRNLNFGKLAAIEFGGYAVGYSVPTIVLAASGAGVWSLVAGNLGQALFLTTSFWVSVRPNVQGRAARRHYTDLLGFGSAVSVLSFLEFLTTNLDTLVLGRLGNPSLLGIYNRGMMLPNVVLYRLHFGVARVLQPVLARQQDEATAFGAMLFRSAQIAIGVVVPTAVGLALASRDVVGVLLGERWMAAAPVLSILSVGLTADLLGSLPASALEAKALLRAKFVVQGSTLIVLVAGLVASSIAIGLSISTVAATVSVAYIARTIVYYGMAAARGHLTGTQTRFLMRHLVLSASVTLVLIGGIRMVLPTASASPAARLAASIGMGILALALINRSILVRAIAGWRGRRAQDDDA